MQQTDSYSSAVSASHAISPGSTPLDTTGHVESVRRRLEEQLNEMLQVLFELSVVVYDFQPEGNRLVWEKINAITDHYQKMDELKDGLDIFVPEEVINYVESGRNPDMFTQTFVERTASENQFTNGKIQAVESFRHLLKDELMTAFPDLGEDDYDFDAMVQPSPSHTESLQ
ncbi:transcription factor subunit Med10 of mediator complex-domain-containing protein [Spinellus fusiger]|nr:transcription factor subunit Med10 of mediator complex-domain-containing protein [Spinellus fusiger]